MTPRTVVTLCIVMFITGSVFSQRKIKRPRSTVGISSVDSLVIKSFDLYENVYNYNSKIEDGNTLSDEESDILEYMLEESEVLSEYTLDALSDLDGQSIIRQGKAALQINRAKKALRYCLDTGQKILLAQNTQEVQTKPVTDTIQSKNENYK